MEWWIIGGLTVVLLILIAIYRRSLRENRNLANYVLLILLDQKIHTVQSKGLADLVRTIDAKNAGELGGRVYMATSQLAERLSGNMLGTYGLLWQLKISPVPPQ
jgi:hypothetical protein